MRGKEYISPQEAQKIELLDLEQAFWTPKYYSNRTCLRNNGLIEGCACGRFCRSRGKIDVIGIRSLKGIHFFAELKELNCSGYLTSINLSQIGKAKMQL